MGRCRHALRRFAVHEHRDEVAAGLRFPFDPQLFEVLEALLDLGPLLSRLAESIRGDVRMRLRVEVGRARIRTSARIVMGVTVFVVVFLYLFSRPLLDVYDSATGQLWLLLILGIFVGGAWLMNHYSQVEMPERFSARHRDDTHQPIGGRS